MNKPAYTNAPYLQMVDDLFKPGAFVMLHPRSPELIVSHQDAGRIGKLMARKADKAIIQLFQDDLIGLTMCCQIPIAHCAPVPDFMVESYEARAGKKGWRVTHSGLSLFKKLGWLHTDATMGRSANDPLFDR